MTVIFTQFTKNPVRLSRVSQREPCIDKYKKSPPNDIGRLAYHTIYQFRTALQK
jgi:hypothetical protein